MVFLASPLTFDPSVVDIFLALSSGAQLLIVPSVIKKMPSRLAQLLFKDHRTTVLQASHSQPSGDCFSRDSFVSVMCHCLISSGHTHSASTLWTRYFKTGRLVVGFPAASVGSGRRSLPIAGSAEQLETRGQ